MKHAADQPGEDHARALVMDFLEELLAGKLGNLSLTWHAETVSVSSVIARRVHTTSIGFSYAGEGRAVKLIGRWFDCDKVEDQPDTWFVKDSAKMAIAGAFFEVLRSSGHSLGA